MAEWLRSGLQSRLHRFDSGRRLTDYSRKRDPERTTKRLITLELVEDGETVDGFWDRVSTNLRAGKVRLVFVADELPAELQRVIEFLNVQMSPAQVIGIEVRQYVGQGLKTLVPRVLGQTAEAQQRKGRAASSPRREWSWQAYRTSRASRRTSCTQPKPASRASRTH